MLTADPDRCLTRARIAAAFILATITITLPGCSRSQYRLQADRDAYSIIAERNEDPRWQAEHVSIDPDERSRFFDPHDPDKMPMPIDDPASQQYMREVNGMSGWEHWGDHGEQTHLESPDWESRLGEYMKLTDSGALLLDVDSAVRLAYVHSPEHQSQLETLYLSALDVNAERFHLDTQLYGGFNTDFAHRGTLFPSSLGYDASTGQYFVTRPSHGAESNRLSIASNAGNPSLQVRRSLATAGQILAGFANSFVFEFSGGDANLSSSLANFAVIQPLLRGAGRDIALEQLTRDERTLLANLRAYAQFRQGFYTRVAIGESAVNGPQRGGHSTSVQVASGQIWAGGYLGLLQDLQEIRNSEDNLDLQLRTLRHLEALLESGLIDLVQVDQFRQNVENERSALLQLRNSFQFQTDQYKTMTLGLPPDLDVTFDDSLIQQFQFVDRESTSIQDAIYTLQDRTGTLPAEPKPDDLRALLGEGAKLLAQIRKQIDLAQSDLDALTKVVPTRESRMTAAERAAFAEDRAQLVQTLAEIEKRYTAIEKDIIKIQKGLGDNATRETVRRFVIWLGDILRLTLRNVLVQARARLESVLVEPVTLGASEAFDVALHNRLDFMNARAALVDNWRTVQVRADALQAVLNVTSSGDIKTAGNNPAHFRAPTGSLRLGVEFDAPLTRLLERNAYREAMVTYQRSRRGLIRSRDTLHQGLRELLRQIRRQEIDLEIQRRAVAISIRRVDMTRTQLYAPVEPPQPGQQARQFGPTSAQNLILSLGSFRGSQNRFMRAWLSHYSARMRLARELGIMKLDPDGLWIEAGSDGGNRNDSSDQPSGWSSTVTRTVTSDSGGLVPAWAPDNTAMTPSFKKR